MGKLKKVHYVGIKSDVLLTSTSVYFIACS